LIKSRYKVKAPIIAILEVSKLLEIASEPIFLIFCVPYVSMLRNKIDKYFILILMVIASNYTWMYNNNLTSVGVFINTIAKCFLFVSLLNLLIKYIYNLFKKYGIKKIFL
jgi:hypothetical protein